MRSPLASLPTSLSTLLQPELIPALFTCKSNPVTSLLNPEWSPGVLGVLEPRPWWVFCRCLSPCLLPHTQWTTRLPSLFLYWNPVDSLLPIRHCLEFAVLFVVDTPSVTPLSSTWCDIHLNNSYSVCMPIFPTPCPLKLGAPLRVLGTLISELLSQGMVIWRSQQTPLYPAHSTVSSMPIFLPLSLVLIKWPITIFFFLVERS